ncbi:MAG: hypothetical protein ACREUT_09555 [Steroidobacteraceae bacterium]
MPASELESKLRAQVRERVRDGRLSYEQPKRLWAGQGSQEICAVCGAIIRIAEVEYEAETDLNGATVVTHFHIQCHAAWKRECVRQDLIARVGSPATVLITGCDDPP